MKNYYELLEIGSTASQDEIKKAFRQQIARYHPDKVHHLGREFQEMAATRAAELTEAYRVLSDEGRRAEYDRARAAVAPPAAPAQPAPAPAPASEAPRSAEPEAPSPKGEAGSPFTKERAHVDQFVRTAALGRLRRAFAAAGGSAYEAKDLPGFDFAYVPKSRLFSRTKGPRVVGKFVATVDAATIADTWTQVAKWEGTDDICLVLLGSGVAPRRELAEAIDQQRKRGGRGPKVTLLPIDARDWQAHTPNDAPDIAKAIVERLQKGG